MSARSIRRTFASPFVVTLAAAALPACYVQSRPATSQPAQPPPLASQPTEGTHTTHDHGTHTTPPPLAGSPSQPGTPTTPPPVHSTSNGGVHPAGSTTVVVSNPPRPTVPPTATPTPRTPVGSTGNAGVQPAPPTPATSPRPPVASTDNAGMQTAPAATSTTRWTVTNTKGTCRSFVDSACPAPVAGRPAMTCNPPPPQAYACPKTLAAGASLKIVQYAGSTACVVEPAKINCPQGAICNPPPPQKIACPK